MKERVFSKNEVVFREGDRAEHFYQVKEGTAGVYLHYGQADQRKLTDVKPGRYFGEMAIIEAWPRSATVVAEEKLSVIELETADLSSYFEKEPDKIMALMNQLGDRLRVLTADYNEVQTFLKEKQAAGAEKKEGFLAKLLKYRELAILGSKFVGCTVEDQIRQKDYGKAADAALPVKTYNKGQIIFREGDEGAYMYQIHSGSVDIWSKYGTPEQVKLTTLYASTFFGEMGLIAQEKRSSTAVVAEDDTTLECIRAEDIQPLFKANPAKVDMILAHLSNRLRSLTRDYYKACAAAGEDA